MKTITRADVAETIYEEVGLSRKDSSDILDMILDEIVQELVKGNGGSIRFPYSTDNYNGDNLIVSVPNDDGWDEYETLVEVKLDKGGMLIYVTDEKEELAGYNLYDEAIFYIYSAAWYVIHNMYKKGE